MKVTDTDLAEIRSAISSQLKAFQSDDVEGALSWATPEIQLQFGSAENFMRMVKSAYQPVYRPRSVMFEEITSVRGIPTQQVLLLATNGEVMRALYLMQKQPDSSWKIGGCYLVPVTEN